MIYLCSIWVVVFFLGVAMGRDVSDDLGNKEAFDTKPGKNHVFSKEKVMVQLDLKKQLPSFYAENKTATSISEQECDIVLAIWYMVQQDSLNEASPQDGFSKKQGLVEILTVQKSRIKRFFKEGEWDARKKLLLEKWIYTSINVLIDIESLSSTS